MMRRKLNNLKEGIGGALVMVVSLLTPFLNDGRRKWGATKAEIERSWPGDDLVPQPAGDYIHAININASADTVWQWLVQIGQDRGGFYSYEFLENLVGCKITTADEIVPEFQRLAVGDDIPMHPKMGSPYKVAAIEPFKKLILLLRVDLESSKTFDPDERMPAKYQNQSWLFYLDEHDNGTTRLISRSRNDWNKSLGNTLFYSIFGPISMEMDKKMLKGIKQRAETAAQ